MKESRQQRRLRERQVSKHFAKLGNLLMKFYAFLESTPKPSDTMVRLTFKEYDRNWKQYCACHKLPDKAFVLFKSEVSAAWKTRYSEKTEQE